MKWLSSLNAYLAPLRGATPQQVDAERQELIRRLPAPTFWLFGKAGSGKSSIVHLLTDADQIQIGNGFRPTTRQTNLYVFPDVDMPVMKFLDTRGLGEAGYDAQHDIAQLKEQAQAMIVTHRLLDFASESVIGPLRTIRRAAPQRPVLLALTCLHEAYPRQQHPTYPFHDSLTPPGLHAEVARGIASQRARFSGLADAIVPLDITRPEEGYEPADYGGDRFIETLHQLLPATYQYSMQKMTELLTNLKDLHERAALPYIHSAASLAATAALAPIPWVDIPVVAAIQTRMVYAIARVYHQQGSAHRLLEMLTVAGIGLAARMSVRELLKVIPYVGTIAGGVLGAAMAYSYTYAMGRVCCWYQSSVLAGHEPTKAEISQVFRNHWREGQEIWKTMRSNRTRR